MRVVSSALLMGLLVLTAGVTAATAEASGRWKLGGDGGCYFDANDDGPDQCTPGSLGRWKLGGDGSCYFDATDGGPELLDRKVIVRPRESIEWVRRFTEVGVFAGISSGAAMAAAAKCAKLIDEGVIVVVVADGGWKYLSTGAWTDDIDVVTERAKKIVYF